MKKYIIFTLALLVLLSSLPACAARELYCEGEGELKVLCTVFAPFDFAREIGGERVTVTLLQDNGADLHNYSPTSATLEALSSADVFIYVGGTSDEAWVYSAIEASGNTSLRTVCLIDCIDGIHAELENDWSDDDHDHSHGDADGGHHSSHAHEGDHEGHDHSADEHVWTSLRNVKAISLEIEEAFASASPEDADYFSACAQDFIAELDALDASFAAAAEASNRKSIVFADRFPFVYLMHDYHIPYVAAFSGCSSEVNASFETQIKLIEAVRKDNLGYVLTTEGNGKSLAKSVSTETGCLVRSLDSLQSVTREDIESGVTYLDVMRKNLSVIKEVLS